MTQATPGRWVLVSLYAIACCAPAACMSRTPAADPPADQAAAQLAESPVAASHTIAWPDRLGQDALGDRGVLHILPPETDGWVGYRVPLGMAIEGDRATMEAIRPLADAVADELGHRDVALSFEQARSYIVVPTLSEDATPGGDRYSVFLSARPPLTELPAIVGNVVEIQRTWFRLTMPEGEPKGLAVVMPGMFGTPEDVVDRIDRLFVERGWASLRMLSPPSRTTERVLLTIDNEAAMTSVAQQAARELDDRNAECAYAVRAAVRDALGTHPQLRGTPRVAIAMSGSAIMLPAVLAWDDAGPDPDDQPGYDAAVLIAGGCHALRIARESSYADWIDSLRVTIDASMHDDTADKLDEAYLAASSLDGYNIAPRVNDRPLLMIHASADRAVPAVTGDLLWERLGQPERWTVPVGHELVFGSVMLRAPGIIAWLEEAVGIDGEATEP